MASYLGNSPDVILQVRKRNYRYVATGGQNTFSGNDSNGQSLYVNTADVEVFLNGVLLDQTDYTITSTQLQLTLNAALDDIVEVITNTTFATADQYSKQEVDSKVAAAVTDLVGTAGTALNTLGELSDALNDDANYAATITTALSAKADTSAVNSSISTINSALALKVGIDSTTGAATLPVGTTAQRPASPTNGMTRFNTTTGYPEWYSATLGTWINYSDLIYSIEYLVVAGGGGGGGAESSNGFGGGGGGGGAGGYLASSTNVTSLTSYSITVGAGGGGGSNSGNPSTATAGGNGSNSTFATVTAIGGGGGGRDEVGGGNPGSGGSGGGVGGDAGGVSPGSGTAGQGYAGASTQGNRGGGGGGGASAAATTRTGANGLNWQSLGTYYAGGGGGGAGAGDTSQASGGLGGGGTGANTNGTSGSNQGSGGETAGGTNTGGGGGAAAAGRSSGGQSGGSGVVIIRYAGPQRGTGGNITSSGGYMYHTFTSSGTFTA